MKVAGAAWREREEKLQQLRLENIAKQEEQQRLDKLTARKERKAARARDRQERYERQKVERQRNHPRNKEMWQEVAKLMVEIQKLEKEERLWNEALVEVTQLEEYHQPPEKMELDFIVEGGDESGNNNILRASTDPESLANTLVGDVTLATERINWVLKSVSLAMTESDKLRREAYDKYQEDGHKFYGYPMVDDPKALFKSLALGSPF
jgi:predicted nuclease with TOPRIM domain